ncbi:MAG: translation initiation factor [Chitinophagaceae bacterium]|nr:translation initiation factor [Chitinophagaceae bacterium]
MSKKKINSFGGLIYSTDPDFKLPGTNSKVTQTPDPSQQQLRIILDTKHRAGKAVTLVYGFTGSSTDLEELGKKMKSYCGTGGSVKDGEIIVQGDHREKVLHWLQKNGYKSAKRV